MPKPPRRHQRGHRPPIVVDNDPSQKRSNGISAATDVLMAALTPGGRERTTEQFVAMAAAAGLRHERTVRAADLAPPPQPKSTGRGRRR